jgi:mono/diheme cytochrome c family protein
MLLLSRIEQRLHQLTPRRAAALAVGLNLLLVLLALGLPADGEARGPALLSVLGNFHILALHLPAALLLIVPLFELLEKHHEASPTVRRLSVISAVGTWFAVAFGILHAHYNGFAGDAVRLHLWGGVAASFFASAASVLLLRPHKVRLTSQIAAVAVMSFAAHIGGELVHEDGFPFRPNKIAAGNNGEKKPPVARKGDDYAEVIAPILEAHCVSCHGAKKVKGKLRMDSLEALKKGGSEGPAFVPGNLAKSGMHARITLDPKADEFMPPPDEKPLTAAQVKAIALWIEGKPIPDDIAASALATARAKK